MKIVVLDAENKVIDIYENAVDVVWQGDKLSWDYGAVPAQTALVLDDTEQISLGDVADPSKDKKAQFKKLTLEEENAELKRQLIEVQLALVDIYEQYILPQQPQ